jgi:phosphate:Na+ symporter
MSGHAVLLNLLAGIALLLWSTRMVRTGMVRAFGDRLRRAAAEATAGRLRACLTGVGIAGAVQSSSATGLIVVSFAERGMVPLSGALALMLGADIGSTLVVQALSFNLAAFVPVLLVAGVSAFMLFRSAILQQMGRAVIGLALMVLSLGMIVGASQELRGDALAMGLQHLGQDPLLATVAGALLAWVMHSSVAMILLLMSLADIGTLPPELGMALVLGANVGSGLIPLGLSLRAAVPARRVLAGNLAFRLIGAGAMLALLPLAAPAVAAIDLSPARQIANFHTAFNLILALAFLPLTTRAARLLERILPKDAPSNEREIKHLDDGLLDRPNLALGSAIREVMRLADIVETMLRETILAFERGDRELRSAIRQLDDPVDRVQEEIKLYLIRLARQPLSDEDKRRVFDLILFTTNLEHIGDIIDKNLLKLAAKKDRKHLAFSPEGWSEIQALHGRVVDQMRLAMTMFVSGDLELARQLVAEKDRIRAAEREATESHLRRLREGTVASIDTSALHLDILRDLKRINAHIVSVAYPILDASGELRESRLRSARQASATSGLAPSTPTDSVSPSASVSVPSLAG